MSPVSSTALGAAECEYALHGGGQRAVRGLVVESEVGIGELGDEGRGHAPER